MALCPHGDPACPCPDGDPCHYEGNGAMPCPMYHALSDHTGAWFQLAPGAPHDEIRPAGSPHCHVEGCTWAGGRAGRGSGPNGCGLARLEPPVKVDVSYELGCGAIRALLNEAADAFVAAIRNTVAVDPKVP